MRKVRAGGGKGCESRGKGMSALEPDFQQVILKTKRRKEGKKERERSTPKERGGGLISGTTTSTEKFPRRDGDRWSSLKKKSQTGGQTGETTATKARNVLGEPR